MSFLIDFVEKNQSSESLAIGAMLLDSQNNIIDISVNKKDSHSEFIVLKRQRKILKCNRGYKLICTLEPCPMCLFLACQVGISHVIFGSYNELYGACNGSFNMLSFIKGVAKPIIMGGVLENQTSSLLSSHFKSIRTLEKKLNLNIIKKIKPA
jgi:tRNA(Arg) A34 adenosine deaminase TadA